MHELLIGIKALLQQGVFDGYLDYIFNRIVFVIRFQFKKINKRYKYEVQH